MKCHSMEEMTKGIGFGIKQAESNVVSVVVNAGHDLDAAGSADRLGVAVLKSNLSRSELIEGRGWDLGFSVVGGQVTETEIVGVED